MIYRKLGRTGEKISAISLGAEHLVDRSQEIVSEVVGSAIDLGMNYIDVFMPQSEVRLAIGQSLKGKRDKVMLAGHLGAALTDDRQYLRTRDPAICLRFVEDFLRRLECETIDVLMLHYVDLDEDATVCIDTLVPLAQKLQKEGKARYIGLSSHVPSVARRLVETDAIDVVLFPINPLLDVAGDLGIDNLFEEATYADINQGRSKERDLFLAACQSRGAAVVAMKTYAAGWILSDKSPLGVTLTPAQCAHYTLSQPAVASAAIGCKTRSEVEAAANAVDAPDEEKDYSILHKAKQYAGQSGLCMYCNHCLPCPVGIDIAAVTRLLDAAETANEIGALREQYEALPVKADACVKCGSCISRCPFRVDARGNMRLAKEKFA